MLKQKRQWGEHECSGTAVTRFVSACAALIALIRMQLSESSLTTSGGCLHTDLWLNPFIFSPALPVQPSACLRAKKKSQNQASEICCLGVFTSALYGPLLRQRTFFVFCRERDACVTPLGFRLQTSAKCRCSFSPCNRCYRFKPQHLLVSARATSPSRRGREHLKPHIWTFGN